MGRLIAITILILLLSIGVGTAFAQGDGVIKVADLSGKVMIKTPPSTEWAEIQKGQTVNSGESIRTEDGAKVLLEFPDKTNFTLKPDTEITVEELIWDAAARKVGVSMSKGELKEIIQKVDTPSEFTVKTPAAICGVRGTIAYIRVLGQMTSIYVEQGAMEFINSISGQAVTVVEGMGSSSGQDGSVSQPSIPSDAEKMAFTSGWGIGLVAEPYSAPPGVAIDAGDVVAPGVTEERVASEI